MGILNKILKVPSAIRNSLQRDKNCQQFCEYFGAHKHPAKGSEILLVQATEDPFYLGLLGLIAQSIQASHGVVIHYYLLRSITVGESISLERWIKARVFDNLLMNYKWRKIYQTFCDKEGFAALGFNPVYDIADFLRAKKIQNTIASKQALVDLVIDGILVGDLIYDCYLRFKPAPTLDVKDRYLWLLLWETLRLLRRSQSYFCTYQPSIYLTSYTVYIQHGIPARVALANQVKVVSFGDMPILYKIQSVNDVLHMRDTSHYASEFDSLPQQEEKLALAEAALQKRLGGGIDVATTYMRQSAYSLSVLDVPDVKDHVIIFLHDFYDGIHIYPDIIFPDFWEWAAFTIDTLMKLNIPFAVKPHPNQIGESAIALDLFIERYPGFKILNPKITNKQLVAAGMSCAITVYGTIGHEMAYMGVPVITCARHPHHSFDFCHNAKTQDEYIALLANARHLPFDKAEMHRQSLAFYYMHNLHKTDGAREMMALVNGIRFKGGNSEVDMLGAMLQLQEMPAFRQQIQLLM